ncbi:MAG: exodeoxyribonuclease VII large subunit [Lachnospiraceae bacterium]|nr:exodeoxyribonuclease VII large subunit [Lachnospiraceae bacterium]
MEKVYSVGQVNSYIKRMVSSDYVLGRIRIKGELSNVKYHTSGHIYFTLKDSRGALRCVMFAGNRMNGLHFQMEDGQSVVVAGRIDVYERDGLYQLYANQIQLSGAGELYERYEQLKVKLEAEGLFDFEHKKPIPAYATRIGVVTASTGAAIQDIASIAHRRNPYVQLYLYPVQVQGEGAAQSIVEGIQVLDKMELDIIIIGRGGGSIEDLWAFNEESVAYAIYNANTPVISGTGHETDTTIADYVADKRAATPSAACELAVFEYEAYRQSLKKRRQQLIRLLQQKKEKLQKQLEYQSLRLLHASPKYRLEQQRQYMDELHTRLETAVQRCLTTKRERLLQQKTQLRQQMERKYEKSRQELTMRAIRLDGLSPTAKLIHGFGYVEAFDKPVSDITALNAGDVVTITMQKGSKKAEILSE